MKELIVRNGYAQCPVCRRQKHLVRVTGEEYVRNIELFCSSCKSKVYVDIIGGKCFQSSGKCEKMPFDKNNSIR